MLALPRRLRGFAFLMKYNIGDVRGGYTLVDIIGVAYKRKFAVRCKCGAEKLIKPDNFKTNGYGCRKCTQIALPISDRFISKGLLPFDHIASKRAFFLYKKSAKKRNIVFKIEYDFFSSIIMQNCHYCGSLPSNKIGKLGNRSGEFKYNGIDRKNSSAGYIKENCAPCCKNCNFLKRDLDYDEFLDLIKKIATHLCFQFLTP